MRIAIAIFLVVLSDGLIAQSQWPEDGIEGFTRANPEHIINERAETISVKVVRGTITRAVGDLGPLAGATFEIKESGKAKRILSVKADKRGQFSISKVPDGTYFYKATMDGFQSEVGTLIVTKTADRRSAIKIELQVGI